MEAATLISESRLRMVECRAALDDLRFAQREGSLWELSMIADTDGLACQEKW